jgi:hypothetical protein
MCPGTEFGITDTVLGVFFAAMTFAAWQIFPHHWYIFVLPVWITVLWFAAGIYFFYRAAKCNCREVYKKLGIDPKDQY